VLKEKGRKKGPGRPPPHRILLKGRWPILIKTLLRGIGHLFLSNKNILWRWPALGSCEIFIKVSFGCCKITCGQRAKLRCLKGLATGFYFTSSQTFIKNSTAAGQKSFLRFFPAISFTFISFATAGKMNGKRKVKVDGRKIPIVENLLGGRP